MGRPYTGWNGNATGKLPGTERFVAMMLFLYGGKLRNLGTWSVRNMKNAGAPRPSVHGTGRAIDLGYDTRATAHHVLDFLTKPEVANALQVEELHDYSFEGGPFGRGWRCDRAAWKVYTKNTIGSPNGKWVHIELAPAIAGSAEAVDAAFARIFAPK
jgi:hypothetical protein